MKAAKMRRGWRDAIAESPARARILVVDDEADIRQSLQRIVTRFGYTAKSASSAEEADQWLSSERFDLLMLDIELPRMKGVEFLSWALSRDPEMAVIMMTGLDMPEVAIECIDHGARTYLVKPVEVEFLRLALRDARAMRRVLVERNDLAERSSSMSYLDV
ncbi:MAG: response regulator [Gemmatimonadetes bacterium]|nr:response regulator [Gemmatimonadota bacterium]